MPLTGSDNFEPNCRAMPSSLANVGSLASPESHIGPAKKSPSSSLGAELLDFRAAVRRKAGRQGLRAVDTNIPADVNQGEGAKIDRGIKGKGKRSGCKKRTEKTRASGTECAGTEPIGDLGAVRAALQRRNAETTRLTNDLIAFRTHVTGALSAQGAAQAERDQARAERDRARAEKELLAKEVQAERQRASQLTVGMNLSLMVTAVASLACVALARQR